MLDARNSISAKGELMLYGDIGDWWDGLDAKTIVEQLNSLPGDEIVVRIQSRGGSVDEGMAMYNNLKQSAKRVIVYIDGIAASMACAVAMAGDVVYIPSNGLMMMHKPLVDRVGGNEADLRDFADELLNYEESYIDIHVEKTGKTFDEIKNLIADRKNHYFRGQAAIDFGLADELIGGVELDSVARAKFSEYDIPKQFVASLFKKPAAAAAQTQEENDMFKIKAKKGGWHYVPAINAALNGTFAKVEDAVTALGSSIAVANRADVLAGKAECDDETLKALAAHFGIEPPTPGQQQQPAAQAGAGNNLTPVEAVAQERTRVRDLRAVAAAAKIDEKDVNAWIDNGITVAEAREKALEIVAKRDAAGAPTSFIRTGSHVGREGMRGAMANALLHRVAPGKHKLDDNGKDFRGMSLMDMVSASLQAAGESVQGKTKTELVALAMHTTSDFPLILQDVANITLRNAYQEAPSTYRMIAVQTTATDFRAKNSVQIGVGTGLEKVNEAGEFKQGTVSEGGETYKLATYGKIFNFSRQLLINDDIGALTRFMNTIGNSAGRLENQIVWGLVKANPNLRDGTAVYAAGDKRKNLIAGAAIDETVLSNARKAMRQMKGLDGEHLNVSAKYLVVNSERETAAQKQLAIIQPEQSSSVNVFARSMDLIVETELDGVANNPFYFFADPNAVVCLEYCYLDGEAGPYIETKWGYEVDGMSLKVRHDFGAGFVDFRGTVKGTGAA